MYVIYLKQVSTIDNKEYCTKIAEHNNKKVAILACKSIVSIHRSNIGTKQKLILYKKRFFTNRRICSFDVSSFKL